MQQSMVASSAPISVNFYLKLKSLILQQEENNNIPSDCEGTPSETANDLECIQKSAHAMLEMRKYTMAAANPILAEKLSTPSEQSLHPLTPATRLQVAPLTPKIERGMN